MKLTATPAVKILNDPNVRNYYVCGDIHGMYSILINKLRSIGFDPLLDKLVCAGDLCDRGWQSVESARLIKEDWFESTLGNHEEFCIEGFLDNALKFHHIENGGAWFYNLSDQDQIEIISLFKSLPYAIEIHHKGLVFGVVHADVLGNDWQRFKSRLLGETSLQNIISSVAHAKRCIYKHAIWSRLRYQTPACQLKPMKGVDAVIFGHNITPRAFRKENFIYIDTGACFSHRITVLKLDENTLIDMPVAMPY